MKKHIYLLLAVLLCTPAISFSQSSVKELGFDIRNVWFGNNVSIILRKEKSPEIFKRRVFTISGGYSEMDNDLTGTPGVPEHYKYNTNLNANFVFEFGREKRVSIFDDLYGYYGPIFSLGISNNSRRTTNLSNGFAFQTQDQITSLSFGGGYLGGIGYSINDRITIQLDNQIQVKLNGSLRNQTSRNLNMGTLEETTNKNQVDQFSQGFSVPSLNFFRLWLVFKF